MEEKLKEFGNVEKCEIIDNKFHILIEDGFNDNTRNTLECIELSMNIAGKDFTIVDKLITQSDHFELILKRK
jgi:fatty acid/phospholipid biosynthesis enzyme